MTKLTQTYNHPRAGSGKAGLVGRAQAKGDKNEKISMGSRDRDDEFIGRHAVGPEGRASEKPLRAIRGEILLFDKDHA